MLVIPAIDLKDGQAVRLFKGDYSQKTVYSDHPEELAQTFEKAGATYLHVVDLDGAKDGLAKNLETIKAIRKSTQMKIELGGGIRDLKTVQLYLDEVGIDRVILGTAALKDPQFLKDVLKQYGNEKIVVGVDHRHAALIGQCAHLHDQTGQIRRTAGSHSQLHINEVGHAGAEHGGEERGIIHSGDRPLPPLVTGTEGDQQRNIPRRRTNLCQQSADGSR